MKGGEKMDNIKQKELSDFVNREVFACQSFLFEEMLKKGFFDYEDIKNLYKTDKELKDDGFTSSIERQEARDRGEDIKEVFEWWLVSDWLLTKLEEKGEVIMRNDYGEWWGRSCTGQAIFLDGIIEKIYDELSK